MNVYIFVAVYNIFILFHYLSGIYESYGKIAYLNFIILILYFEQYDNASCKRYYRRRTLESCFHHPSKMIYPPGESYTPETTPEPHLDRSHVKPSQFDDITFKQKINREEIDFRSESRYVEHNFFFLRCFVIVIQINHNEYFQLLQFSVIRVLFYSELVFIS